MVTRVVATPADGSSVRLGLRQLWVRAGHAHQSSDSLRLLCLLVPDPHKPTTPTTARCKSLPRLRVNFHVRIYFEPLGLCVRLLAVSYEYAVTA